MPITLASESVTGSSNLILSSSSTERGRFYPNGLIIVDGTFPTNGDIKANVFNGGQLAGYRNKIINGKMNIAQRGTSISYGTGTVGSYDTVDRFLYFQVADSAVTLSQVSDTPSSNEFQYSLRATVNTADTSIAAGQYAGIAHLVEGYNARDLLGRTFTLSFWVRSAKTGTHSVSFRNNTVDRSYITTYSINAANTWEFKSITVTNGLSSAGNWNWTNGIGINIVWALAVGSTFATASTGTWVTGNFLGTTQVNCLDTVGNIFAITGVQLEVGARATPFEHRLHAVELQLCQRYFQVHAASADDVYIYSAYANTNATHHFPMSYTIPLRASPVATIAGTWGTASLSAFTVTATALAYRLNMTVNAAPGQFSIRNNGAGSRLTFSAEL